MKYTIERLPESRVAIDVEIDPERVEKALNRAARRISKRARIPGFRPGKAPRYIIEARYGRAALYEEASEELLQRSFEEILEQGEFDPVGSAELESLNLDPFAFRLIVPVRATVTLGDYHALRFHEEHKEVTEEDVLAVLEHTQEEQTIWKEPDPARPAQTGDRLLVDLIGQAGERELENREQVELTLGEEHLLPGFSEALTGAETGQTIEVTTTLPEELEDEELAGQAATYTVTVHTIREPEVPPLDDEFARSYGQEETLEEMRARIRGELEEAARNEARSRVLDQIFDALVEGAEVDMPQVLVEREADLMFEQQQSRIRSIHISLTQYLQALGKDEEEYRQELREAAPDRLRRSLVMQEFIRAEGLTGEGEELQKSLEERLLALARGEIEAVAEPTEDAPTAEEAESAAAEEEPAEDTPTVEEAEIAAAAAQEEPAGEEGAAQAPEAAEHARPKEEESAAEEEPVGTEEGSP